MSNTQIPLARPYLGDQEVEAVKKVMASGCPSGTCPEVRLFEEEFAEYVRAGHAVAVSSGTAALHLACLSTGVDRRSTVVVPAFTFPATAYAPIYCGARVVFADVDVETYNIDLSTIPSSVHPTHIIPVHCLGNPCNIDELVDYCQDNDVTMIEDSACGVASTYSGTYVGHTGTFGSVGCYSLYGIKELCTGEGGMLVTDNGRVASVARKLANFGAGSVKGLFERIGFNYRLSAIQAAIGRVQLGKLDDMHLRRQRIAEVYTSYISKHLDDVLRVQRVLPGCTHSYQRFAARLVDGAVDRDTLIRRLHEKGIQAGIGTYELTTQPLFDSLYTHSVIARHLARRTLSLPMYPGMSVDDAQRVMEALKDSF